MMYPVRQFRALLPFAATLALIAGYQHGLPWMSSGGDTALAARIAL